MLVHASTALQIVVWAVVVTTVRGHGLTPPTPLAQRQQQQQSGAPVHVPLTYWILQKYTAPVLVGTPPQYEDLTLDQSVHSPLLFYSSVTNASLLTYTDQGSYTGNPHFKPGNSTTFKAGTTAARADNTSWLVGTDAFSVGGVSETVDNGLVLLDVFQANKTTPRYSYIAVTGQSNGFLGLAMHQDTDVSAVSLMQDLVGKLEQPTMGMYFGNSTPVLFNIGDDLVPTNDTEGAELVLGGTNQSFYQGAITYTNATATWQTPLEALTVNGQTITLSDMTSVANQSQVFTAAQTGIGPGANALVFPPDVAAAIMAAIPGSEVIPANDTDWAGRYIVPCNSSAEMVVTIGGQQYPINPIYLFTSEVYDSARFMCISTIDPDTPENYGGTTGYLLGVPFLRNVYTVYNYGTSQIGLAKLAAGLNTATVSDLYYGDASVTWDAPSGTTEPTTSATGKHSAATRSQACGAVVVAAAFAALYMA